MPDMTFVGSMSEITSHSNEKIASELRKTTEEVCEGAKKVVEESQEKKWMNLFKGNRLATQGMTLQYVALLVRNGEIVVELCKTEVELETQKWEHSLIVYVLGLNLPLRHSKEDMDEVFYAGPHMLNQNPIIVKKWTSNFYFNKEMMQTIPIWVKFPNLPLKCWGVQSLSRIASGLRIPIYADECTMQVDRISYARLLIEMGITETLPTELKVEDPNGRSFTQVVQYEWVPIYCSSCLTIGHTCQHKDDSVTKANPKHGKQIMEWKQHVNKQAAEEELRENVVDNSDNQQEVICDQRHGKGLAVEEQNHQLSQWNEVRGKFATKIGMHQDMNQLIISNDFSVFHGHNTRFVAVGGRDKGGRSGGIGSIPNP
ncbi:hypothetical protein KY285_011784 [Solanum tuberosum]|nr:hypothetical protein KY289_003908 [Solanum tuberosum]KAH0736077.1 hypothetical protein KY285_011784 [Solanum tuberosum]